MFKLSYREMDIKIELSYKQILSNTNIYFSIEVLGKFPGTEEASALSISPTIPVWLPLEPFDLTSDIKSNLKIMRKAVNSKCILA